MKVCVFGAGAVGGNVATRLLAAQAADISIVARGATLQAIRERGLTLHSLGREYTARPKVATDDPAMLPPQDLVISTVKGYRLPAIADTLARLIAPQGCALFMLNGIPWWWRHGLPGVSGPLPLVDPQGTLWTKLTPQKALGCVVGSPNEVTAPGVILNIGANRYIMGEPDGSLSARLNAAVELFRRSGIEAQASTDIRREIWRKLSTNAYSNPLTALTRLGLAEIGAEPELCQLAATVMRETVAVAAALGWDLRSEVDPEKISMHAGRQPGVRSSMLQDVVLKRPLEVESHLGQIQAFAREVGVAVPAIDVIVPLLRGLDRALRAS